MKNFKFKQIKNEKYHVIIKAENYENAKHRYKVLYGFEPDI